MKTMTYKGYAARIEFSDEDDCFVRKRGRGRFNAVTPDLIRGPSEARSGAAVSRMQKRDQGRFNSIDDYDSIFCYRYRHEQSPSETLGRRLRLTDGQDAGLASHRSIVNRQPLHGH